MALASGSALLELRSSPSSSHPTLCPTADSEPRIVVDETGRARDGTGRDETGRDRQDFQGSSLQQDCRELKALAQQPAGEGRGDAIERSPGTESERASQ